MLSFYVMFEFSEDCIWGKKNLQLHAILSCSTLSAVLSLNYYIFSEKPLTVPFNKIKYLGVIGRNFNSIEKWQLSFEYIRMIDQKYISINKTC